MYFNNTEFIGETWKASDFLDSVANLQEEFRERV